MDLNGWDEINGFEWHWLMTVLLILIGVISLLTIIAIVIICN